MSRLRLLALLFSLVASPALAHAGELVPLAAPNAGPLRGINSPISVAFGPEGGVAVWKVGFGAIWGTPLDRDGRPTATARWILGERDGLDQPEVRFIDGSFVLWWIRAWPRGSRVARLDGELRPGEARTVAVNATAPSAWNGTLALVATGSYPISYDVSVHFLDRDFARFRSDSLTDLGRVSRARAVALEDRTFGVVTSGERGVFLIRYSAEGERLGAPRQIDGYTAASAIATDGESVLIAGTAGSVGAPPPLRIVVIRSDGALSPSQTIGSNAWESIYEVEIRWAAGMYTIAIAAGRFAGLPTDDLDLYAARLSKDGEPITGFEPLLVRSGIERSLELATSGMKHFLYFGVGGYGMQELLGVSFGASGPLFRPDLAAVDMRVSDTAALQEQASAASDGPGYRAAWIERTATREEIRTVPLDSEGMPAGAPATLASLPLFRLGSPNVAFNGVDYVVAWSDWGTLFVKRFRRDGTPVDDAPIAVASGLGASVRPSAAAKDGLTLFAWPASGSIRGALFYADGRSSATLALSPAAHEEEQLNVAYDYGTPILSAGAGGFLVAFTERRSLISCFPGSCGGWTRAQGQLISRDGALRGPVMTFDEEAPHSSAAAGGTHLLTFGSGRAAVIDGASAKVLRILPPTIGAGAAFEAGGEYVIASSRSPALLVKRLAPDGSLLRAEETEASGYVGAASASGTLLLLSARSILEPPYFGTSALLSGVADTFVPVSSERRRLAGR